MYGGVRSPFFCSLEKQHALRGVLSGEKGICGRGFHIRRVSGTKCFAAECRGVEGLPTVGCFAGGRDFVERCFSKCGVLQGEGTSWEEQGIWNNEKLFEGWEGFRWRALEGASRERVISQVCFLGCKVVSRKCVLRPKNFSFAVCCMFDLSEPNFQFCLLNHAVLAFP